LRLFLRVVMTDLPTLVFATQNQGKLEELKGLIAEKVHLISLNELNFDEDIPETTGTLEGNAHQKASTIYKRFGKPCFSDDSGLFVNALDGAPGVDSAHYSGSRDNEKNIAHLLNNLSHFKDRRAYFKTIFCLITHENTYYFEGIAKGHIADSSRGNNGFGYDPIFVPEGYNQTFGELDKEIKKSLSHRARATRSLIEFLRKTDL
jgi:XTP/dITP diphosphohydrolase